MNKRVKSNSIRIISGEWRGRKLTVLDSQGLRPTTDRVRETLFNWLMYEVRSARCLDLFAGTGALGFESLSRGAEFVQFVELQGAASRSIKQHLSLLDVESSRASVSNTSYEHFMSTPPVEPFDIVYLDPPFDEGLLPTALTLLSKPGWLSERALVYIEQSSSLTPVDVPEQWQLYKANKAGQSRYHLYSLSQR